MSTHEHKPAQSDTAPARERTELARVLRERTRSENEALLVLDVFAEALELACLDVDDPRLHVNFGASTKWPVNIVIGKRSVAWLDVRKCFVGLLLDDARLAERTAARLHPEAYSSMFRRPDAPGIHVSIEHLRSTLPAVRGSWHRAITRRTREAWSWMARSSSRRRSRRIPSCIRPRRTK